MLLGIGLGSKHLVETLVDTDILTNYLAHLHFVHYLLHHALYYLHL